MSPDVRIAAEQLRRMRGMNALYHRRFFSDVRYTTVVILGLFVAGVAIERALFLLVPVVALIGACQTAFDASYLIFSRQYATRLERFLNRELGRDVLVAHRLEDVYLFPLDRPKIVTLAGGSSFTWFGFMTAFYTLIGAASYLAGLWLGLSALPEGLGRIAYWTLLLGLTLAALVVGGWWFVGGEGERRLRTVLDEAFGAE
jgi:hypothetical protein